jgi:hypothetical protein
MKNQEKEAQAVADVLAAVENYVKVNSSSQGTLGGIPGKAGRELIEKFRALEKAQTPEPFEAFLGDEELDDFYEMSYADIFPVEDEHAAGRVGKGWIVNVSFVRRS